MKKTFESILKVIGISILGVLSYFSLLIINEGSKSTYSDTTNPKTSDVSISSNNNDVFLQYEVKKGDSIESIWLNKTTSYPLNVSIDIILLKNNLETSKDIYQGQILYIPTKIDLECIKYTVKGGDTILSIANAYKGDRSLNEMVKCIEERNGAINIQNIMIGQTLLIP